MGPLPKPDSPVPLDVEHAGDGAARRQRPRPQAHHLSHRQRRISASPPTCSSRTHAAGEKLPAMLCLHQTTKIGKEEPAGLGGNPNLHYALHLAQRGYVTLAPDYPVVRRVRRTTSQVARLHQRHDEGDLGQHARRRPAAVAAGSRRRAHRLHRPFARRAQRDVHRRLRAADQGASSRTAASRGSTSTTAAT